MRDRRVRVEARATEGEPVRSPAKPVPADRIWALASAVGNRAFGALLSRTRTLARYSEAVHLEVERPEREEPGPPGREPAVQPLELYDSVGRGGSNNPEDVATVRRALRAVEVDPGDTSESLAAAIEAYQRDVLAFKRPDGRVDAGGQTATALAAGKKKPKGKGPGPKPAPAKGQPDFSPEVPLNPLPSLQPGDHVWYWKGRSSTINKIPRDDWFGKLPGYKKNDPTDYRDNGADIYNFVIYPDHVKCGQPHMRDKAKYPGSFAWLNNNPGNLSGPTGDCGQYKGKLNGSPPKTPGFLVFPTVEAGRDGLEPWLRKNGPKDKKTGKRTMYIDMSIRDAWEYYDKDDAPRYVQLIKDKAGLPPERMLNTLDKDEWIRLKAAIREAEGTIAGWTYGRSDPRLPAAIRNAF